MESILLQDLTRLIAARLKEIANNTRTGCCTLTTTAGTANVPAHLHSVTITQVGTGTVVIMLSDGSTYTLSAAGEQFTQSTVGDNLPAYTISSTGGATWKWYGQK
jgi:hypothetical protein